MRVIIFILTALLTAGFYENCFSEEELPAGKEEFKQPEQQNDDPSGSEDESKQPEQKKDDQPDSELPSHLIRDPFWPIGWAPKDWGKDVDEVKKIGGLRKWSSARKEILVTGVSQSRGKYFAVIKGQGLKEIGDIISITHMGLVYRWKITDIKPTGIATEKLDVTPAK